MAKATEQAVEFGGLATPRIPIASLPADIVAVVEPDQGQGLRDRYLWQLDGYGIIKVGVYLAPGTRLPAGGLTVRPSMFNKARGTDKPQRGTAVGVYEWGDTDPETGRPANMVSVEAPAGKGYKIASLHVEHATG